MNHLTEPPYMVSSSKAKLLSSYIEQPMDSTTTSDIPIPDGKPFRMSLGSGAMMMNSSLFKRKSVHHNAIDMRIPATKSLQVNEAPPLPPSRFLIFMDMLVNKFIPTNLLSAEHKVVSQIEKSKSSIRGGGNLSIQIADLLIFSFPTRKVVQMYHNAAPLGLRKQWTYLIYEALQTVIPLSEGISTKTLMDLVVTASSDKHLHNMLQSLVPREEAYISAPEFDRLFSKIPNEAQFLMLIWSLVIFLRSKGVTVGDGAGSSKAEKRLRMILHPEIFTPSPIDILSIGLISGIDEKIEMAMSTVASLDPLVENELHEAFSNIEDAFYSISEILGEPELLSTEDNTGVPRDYEHPILREQFKTSRTEEGGKNTVHGPEPVQAGISLSQRFGKIAGIMIPSLAVQQQQQQQQQGSQREKLVSIPQSMSAQMYPSKSPARIFNQKVYDMPDWLGDDTDYRGVIRLDHGAVYMKYVLMMATAKYLEGVNPEAAGLSEYIKILDIEFWEEMGEQAAALAAFSLLADMH